MPAWSLAAQGGVDSGATTAFATGLDLMIYAGFTIFAIVIGWHLIRRLISAAGF